MTENTETMVNNTNMLAELIEAKVALAKAEMQLEWQKAELAKKDHSKLEPDLMAPLFEALAKAQAEFGTVSATSRVTFKNVDFKFAPLSEILGAVRPALNKYGLTLTQQTKHIPFGNANGIKVVTTLLHESGVSYDIESVPVFYNVNDIKNLGAQVTYLRRYEVKTLLGIEADSEELDMDNVPNVPNHSQSVQQTGNYDSNHNYQSKAQAKTPRKPTGARYGKTAQSASLATSLSSSEQTSLSEVTSANKVASDSVSQATSEAESSSQKSETATQPKGTKTNADNAEQLIQMVARGEEAALSLGATESQLLEWSQIGESQGLTVQLKALSDFVSKQRQQAQQQ
ncbi:ERF family protein [Streptococcus salivarius]|uniref:ERF family protein n=1 Tax=Streptococcus salivarius TaxID=1304 RepID=UPI0018A039BC|nr:ERF family protein [Streptococcus salivarius]